ncbi:MAG: DUF6147 family protein [Candidatus Limivivens sp.]|nr:DUF6147 family protein [Candidatus Limivivens sp.]
MRNKNWGFLFTFVWMVCYLCISVMAVNAEGPLDGQIIDGSLLTSEMQAEDTRELVLEGAAGDGTSSYGTYLSYGTAGISNVGGGQVNFYGDTVCFRTSDVVKVNLHLQQLKNGVWSDYTTRYCTKYNTCSASAGYYATVPTGYYYRVKGTHSATKGSTVESTTTYTNAIYIS